jgi:hypothetical protein
MIVRELSDGTVLVIAQEGHADVAAQFAAHWGGGEFTKLDPYQSMVFGTIYHDSGHREMEADLPIDVERGIPYGMRRTPPGLSRGNADAENCQWMRKHDPYASLVASMHRSGLRKRRYDTVRMRWADRDEVVAPPAGEAPLGMDAAFGDFEDWQREVADELHVEGGTRDLLWHNYRALQVFDLLSLYLCCDGYANGRMREASLERVPVAVGSDKLAELRLQPTGPSSLRIDPFPFDAPLQLAVMAHCVAEQPDVTEPEGREAYYKAPRQALVWDVTG